MTAHISQVSSAPREPWKFPSRVEPRKCITDLATLAERQTLEGRRRTHVHHKRFPRSRVQFASAPAGEPSEGTDIMSNLANTSPTSSPSQSYTYWRNELAPAQGETQASANLRVSQLSSGQLLGNVCRLGAEAPAKIEGVTLMRSIHSNL